MEKNEINSIIESICNSKIENKKINSEPLCILLGGLPGSGKTNLLKLVQEQYKDRDFVIIDIDDFRKLHPDYKKLVKTPERTVIETSDFSNKVEERLIQKSIEKHCDIISVTTLRLADVIDELLYRPAIEQGYKIEVNIMSVPIKESGLSAQNRYERQIKNGECPRFTPMEFVEISYDGIQNTIKMLQNKEDMPIIKIYNRGIGENSFPVECYNNKKIDNKYISAIDAFNNPVKSVSFENASAQINELYNQKKWRDANSIEYSSLERLEELFEKNN